MNSSKVRFTKYIDHYLPGTVTDSIESISNACRRVAYKRIAFPSRTDRSARFFHSSSTHIVTTLAVLAVSAIPYSPSSSLKDHFRNNYFIDSYSLYNCSIHNYFIHKSTNYSVHSGSIHSQSSKNTRKR